MLQDLFDTFTAVMDSSFTATHVRMSKKKPQNLRQTCSVKLFDVSSEAMQNMYFKKDVFQKVYSISFIPKFNKCYTKSSLSTNIPTELSKYINYQ